MPTEKIYRHAIGGVFNSVADIAPSDAEQRCLIRSRWDFISSSALQNIHRLAQTKPDQLALAFKFHHGQLRTPNEDGYYARSAVLRVRSRCDLIR